MQQQESLKESEKRITELELQIIALSKLQPENFDLNQTQTHSDPGNMDPQNQSQDFSAEEN